MSESPRPVAGSLSRPELVALIASLMALNAAAIDIFIPALQDIGTALGVDDQNQRQFVISSYVLGFGGAQLFFGPLSDSFGRKPILFAGLAIYIAAAFASAWSPTFALLLLFRFLQGVGAAATRVVAISVVRDCFGGRQMASIMSLVMMVFMAIPVVAPNIGQVILIFGSWRAIALGTAVFSIGVLAWATLRLPETLAAENRRPLTVERTVYAFRVVLTTRVALCYTLASALIFGVLFGFINSAEQVYTEVFELGPTFTLWFSAVAIVMSAVSFVNSRLVERFGMRRLSHAAMMMFVLFSALQLVVALWMGDTQPFWLFYILIVPTFCCFGFIGTNFNALAMDPLGHVAGTASSVLGFCQTLGGGICGAIVGYLYNGTLVPLFSSYIVLSLASLGLVLVGEHGQLFERKYRRRLPDGRPAPDGEPVPTEDATEVRR